MLDSPLHEFPRLKYQVDIEDKPMRGLSKTAHICFFDENNEKFCIQKYGVISPEEIYQKMDAGEDVSLNNAYIFNFSLTDYRVSKGLDDSVFVTLKNFSAKKAFFHCDFLTDFTYAKFEGDKTVFDSVIFGNGSVNFSNSDFVGGDVSFKKAKFGSGTVSFQSVHFGEGNVGFNNCNFGIGNLSFVDCSFNHGNVDFKNAITGDGNVDFKFARFSDGDISFEKAGFGKGKKDFKNTEFGGGKIDFRRVDFNDGDVNFEGVEFGDGKASFRSSTFGDGHKSFDESDFARGETQFDLVDFGSGKVSFNRAKVYDISFKGCALNCYVDLRLGECHSVDLTNTIVRDIVDLMPEYEHVVIRVFNISGMKILGRIFIDWNANDVYNMVDKHEETTLLSKAEQFRTLKENFRNNGQYEDEDAAYLEFKRFESKARYHADKISPNFLKKSYAFLNYYFQRYVFDFIGHYGTNPIRVVMNMAITFC